MTRHPSRASLPAAVLTRPQASRSSIVPYPCHARRLSASTPRHTQAGFRRLSLSCVRSSTSSNSLTRTPGTRGSRTRPHPLPPSSSSLTSPSRPRPPFSPPSSPPDDPQVAASVRSGRLVSPDQALADRGRGQLGQHDDGRHRLLGLGQGRPGRAHPDHQADERARGAHRCPDWRARRASCLLSSSPCGLGRRCVGLPSADQALRTRLRSLQAEVLSARFSPDGNMIAACSSDSNVCASSEACF
jgi:hypothetical protein